MDVGKARDIVCLSGQKLLKEGLVARTWGNVSIRVSETEMIITPSGRKYNEVSPEDMVLVNIHTLNYIGLKPSSELKLHCEIYKTRPQIRSVIHTHQMYASIIAAAQKDLEVLDTEHQAILGGTKIKAAPYALPNSKAITIGTAKAVGNTNAALMANHGAVCIGTDIEAVFKVVHTLESACKQFLEFKKDLTK